MNKQIVVLAALAAVLASPVLAAHAYPCSGGSGKSYCSGYHAGAVAADKQFSKGGLGGLTCPGGHTAEYCNGWDKGYLDESNQLD